MARRRGAQAMSPRRWEDAFPGHKKRVIEDLREKATAVRSSADDSQFGTAPHKSPDELAATFDAAADALEGML